MKFVTITIPTSVPSATVRKIGVIVKEDVVSVTGMVLDDSGKQAQRVVLLPVYVVRIAEKE